ncbi:MULTISPECIES: hypothetical protein [unclassified Kribbella]|uniref:hypothetical protein n=1 Tax=unclassified Kribbella TaxID=2644121 RepID=UPI003015DFEF
MTDQDLEQLLRETFADKEDLVDSLPQATKRRRPVGPVLLAAAAVLVVLGGILYGVNRDGGADPAPPPVAVAPAGDDAEIWGAAIATITERFQSKYDLRTVALSDGFRAARFQENTGTVRAFSVAEKDRIADLVAKAAGVQVTWSEAGPETAQCIRTLARVGVGDVVDKGDHKEVRTSIAYNCGYAYLLTYRVEKRGDTWTVTGTVGVAEGVMPASGCSLSGQTPASPRQGC